MIPVADAYESLKLAGRRSGARLCGTRLRTDGGNLLAERDDGPETLFNIGGPSRYTNALHGGDRIQFFDDARWDRREIAYQPGGLWREVPVAPVDRPSLGATYLSQSRVSHNADSVVSAENDGIYIGLNALDRKWRRLQSQPPLPSGGSRPDSVCWGGTDAGNCVLGWTSVGSSTHSVPYAAYSPMGDSIFAAVTTYSNSTRVSGLTEHCRSGSGVDSSGILNHTICPRFTTTSGPDETRVYAVPILSADPPRLVYTVPGAEVTWIGVGEGASEFVLHLRSAFSRAEGQGTCSFLADGYTNYCGQGMTYTTTTQDCRYEWVSARGVLLSKQTTQSVCLGLGEATITGARKVTLQPGPRREPAASPFLLRPQLSPGFH